MRYPTHFSCGGENCSFVTPSITAQVVNLYEFSMVTFVIAIAYYCFSNVHIQTGLLALPSALVFFMLVWEINTHWKSSNGTKGTLIQKVHRGVRRHVEAFKSIKKYFDQRRMKMLHPSHD